jgi:UDP-glucose 4-epimerase
VARALDARLVSVRARVKDHHVLVTGGLGFIGSNLVHELVARGAIVTVYDNLDPSCGGNRNNLEGVEDHIELIGDDIRNFDALAAAVRGKQYVFHCAARTSHPGSMTDPVTDIAVNCTGTINLLEAVRRFQADAKIVHVGTSTQIGRHVAPKVTELHPEFPVDIYSANKVASEKYVLIYGTAHRMRTTVVRLANNFGPRANIRSPQFGFVNYFVGLALQGKELTVFGDGAQLRTISFVGDSVAALLLAAESANADGEVWFAVADGQTSVVQIATAITDEIGGTVRHVPWPPERAAIEIGDAVIDNSKIRSRLGWAPRVAIAEGLRHTKAYFDSRSRGYL